MDKSPKKLPFCDLVVAIEVTRFTFHSGHKLTHDRPPSQQACLDPVAIEVTRFTCPRDQAFIFDVGRDVIRNLLSWRKLRLLRSRWTLASPIMACCNDTARHGVEVEGLR